MVLISPRSFRANPANLRFNIGARPCIGGDLEAAALDAAHNSFETGYMYSSHGSAKPRNNALHPPLQSPRLLGQVRERLRYLHYSLKTEQNYLYWVRFFVHFSGLRHPAAMGKPEVEAFLTMLATERKVSVSTHRQALSALLFLYREVLAHDLPWLQDIGRPVAARRIPSVLSVPEIERLLGLMDGQPGLLARLLYGTGMRLMEGLALRVKDVDFSRHAIVVREGKGGKDRVVMLPRSLVEPLREQLARSRTLWQADRAAGRSGVFMPHARTPNIHVPASRGRGTGYSPRRACRRIPPPASSGATTCTKNVSSAR